MPLKTYLFDASRHLATEESQRELLADAIGSGDPTYIAHALGVVARARGMSSIALEAGVPRETIYQALEDDKAPDTETLMKVLRRMGVDPSTIAAE